MQAHNFTTCDIVRQESTGKFILIGVYTNSISVNAFPAQFFLNFWCLLEAEELGPNPFSFRVRVDGSEGSLIEVEAEYQVSELANWNPFVFGGPVHLDAPSSLIVEAKLNNDEWKAIRRISVQQMPTEQLAHLGLSQSAVAAKDSPMTPADD